MSRYDSWRIGKILGCGTYGNVRLALNESSGERAALKSIDLTNRPGHRRSVKNEINLHRILKHSNVIRFISCHSERNSENIFLEYAAGGDLFYKISPGIGLIPKKKIKKYFSQLISAVDYLHSAGIAHRDLKPENLLLDSKDNLKVADFGLAIIFRSAGKERILKRRCGTMPYVAPEVHDFSYHAGLADVWSCGIILVVMLTGVIPWEEATNESPEYVAWKSGDLQSYPPWKQLERCSLRFVRDILKHTPGTRLTVKEIKEDVWWRSGIAKR